MLKREIGLLQDETKLELSHNASKWLIDEVNKYILNGFGSKNKNDFEVLIFNALLQDLNFRKKSNFAKAKILGISEAKIKRLNYEADLKYKRNETELYKELVLALETVTVKGNTNLLQFVIGDKYLRGFLDDLLKSRHCFSDSSFNSEIVTIDFKDLLIIYESFSQGKDDLKEIMKSAYQCLNPKITPKKLFENLLTSLQNSSNITGATISATATGIKALIKKIDKAKFMNYINHDKK